MLAHGTGALNIDGCRVGTEQTITVRNGNSGGNTAFGRDERKFERVNPPGRFPANLIHDGSDEVLAAFPEPHGAGSARDEPGGGCYDGSNGIGFAKDGAGIGVGRKGFRIGDSGSAARFFKSCPLTIEDIVWNPEPASYAVECSSLQSEAAVSVLSHAVARSIPGSALLRESYRAPSTSATAEEFETLCGLVIATTRSFGERCLPASAPPSITISHGLAECGRSAGRPTP